MMAAERTTQLAPDQVIQWVGIDVGNRRTGVATSTSGSLTTGWGLLEGPLDQQIVQLGHLLRDWSTSVLVVGQPTRHAPDHPTQQFIDQIRQHIEHAGLAVEVVIINEDLSTKEAERLGHRGAQSDVASAQLILEDYFRMEPIHHAK